jgi:hypothetical protein
MGTVAMRKKGQAKARNAAPNRRIKTSNGCKNGNVDDKVVDETPSVPRKKPALPLRNNTKLDEIVNGPTVDKELNAQILRAAKHYEELTSQTASANSSFSSTKTTNKIPRMIPISKISPALPKDASLPSDSNLKKTYGLADNESLKDSGKVSTPSIKSPYSISSLQSQVAQSNNPTINKSLFSSPKESGGKDLVPVSSIGLKFATFKSKGSTMTGANLSKQSYLRAVIIPGPEFSAIMFRCESVDPLQLNGPWSDKIFFDAVKHQSNWVKTYGIVEDIYYWHHLNEPQLNQKNYKLRLFAVFTENIPDEGMAIKLGKLICNQINITPGNNTTISVKEDYYFWLDQPVVWSDVIGHEQAFKEIINHKGQPYSGFFEEHEELIHSYFHPCSFDHSLARALYAPNTSLHPSLLCEENQLQEQTNESFSFEQSYNLPRDEEGNVQHEAMFNNVPSKRIEFNISNKS